MITILWNCVGGHPFVNKESTPECRQAWLGQNSITDVIYLCHWLWVLALLLKLPFGVHPVQISIFNSRLCKYKRSRQLSINQSVIITVYILINIQYTEMISICSSMASLWEPSDSDKTNFKSWFFHLLVLWPWAIILSLLGHDFLISEIRVHSLFGLLFDLKDKNLFWSPALDQTHRRCRLC